MLHDDHIHLPEVGFTRQDLVEIRNEILGFLIDRFTTDAYLLSEFGRRRCHLISILKTMEDNYELPPCDLCNSNDAKQVTHNQ